MTPSGQKTASVQSSFYKRHCLLKRQPAPSPSRLADATLRRMIFVRELEFLAKAARLARARVGGVRGEAQAGAHHVAAVGTASRK